MSGQSKLRNPQLLTLGGISGILAGLFILTFFIISASKGLLFTPEIYSGESLEYWIQNVVTYKEFAKWSLILPICGFSSMLLTASVVYKILQEDYWQKHLSIVAYFIGGILILPGFANHQGTVNYVISSLTNSSVTIDQIQQMIRPEAYRFMILNDYLGPFFVIVLGTGFMTLAIMKAKILPNWLCYWSLLVSVFLLLSFFNAFIPFLGVFGIAAPFHMLWFIFLGIYLLRIRQKVPNL